MVDAATLKSRRTLIVVLAVALIVAAVAVGWFVIRPQMNMARACDAVKALNAERDDSVPVSYGSRTAIVYGDSYAQGWELEDPRASWPAEFGTEAGYEVTVNAVGSSGLQHSGMCQGTGIVSRVTEGVPATDLLVIQTGLNDVWTSDEDIESAINDIAAAARSDVLLVGPTNAPGMADEDVARVEDALSAAAREVGWDYVSLYGLTGLTYLDDGVHVDQASQSIIGERVADAAR